MPESLVLVVVVHEVVEAGRSGIAAMLAAVWPSGSHVKLWGMQECVVECAACNHSAPEGAGARVC